MIRKILVITSVLILLVMVLSSTVIGKGWLSEEKIKAIAKKEAYHAKYHIDEGGKHKTLTRKLNYDYIVLSPVITHIPADTFYNHFRIISYVKEMPAGPFAVGGLLLDVYGGGRKVPGPKGASVISPLHQSSDPFDEEEAKKIFKEKKGVEVCIIFPVHWPVKCESPLHSALGLVWEWLIVDVEGMVYTMRPGIWLIKSFPDMARELESIKVYKSK